MNYTFVLDMHAPRKLYMGLDFGTQSLKCMVMNENFHQVYATRVHYDEDLPQFQTKHGILMGQDRVTAPSMMVT